MEKNYEELVAERQTLVDTFEQRRVDSKSAVEAAKGAASAVRAFDAEHGTLIPPTESNLEKTRV